MAVSLEAREPLLDHRLVEFAARIRPDCGFAMARQMADEENARALFARGDPLSAEDGLVTPISAWFRVRSPTSGSRRESSALATLGWFDPDAIARVAADHRSGRVEHGRLLWQLLTLEKSLQVPFGLGVDAPYSASTKYSPSGGALNPRAARSRA